MNSGLAVDDNNELKELRAQRTPQPLVLRLVAKLISIIFHPVFVPVYLVLFLVYIHPYVFAGFSNWDRSKVIIQAIMMFTFFPIVTVSLLKGLKFIQSFQLTTQKDRIIPLVACMIWYFWIWYVWKNIPDYPKEGVMLGLAIFLGSIAALMANIYMKVSLHAISMGVAITFMINLALNFPGNMGIFVCIVILATGLVSTARFIASDHTPGEIYGGLFLGILSQLIASVFV
jgi:hypothetical protein